ncbi:MAG: response regulator [Deltaproteobacteria bacterium]|nr:response regulator [Deltaproteobacteria bacterium]
MNAPLRVLFVDDEAELLGGLRRRLRRARELEASYAIGAEQALTVLGERQFEVVVSDLRMPEIDGPTLLATVAERWPRYGRLLLTGCAQPGLERHFGVVHAVLGKPCPVPRLRAVLGRARDLRQAWPADVATEPPAYRAWWTAVVDDDEQAGLGIADEALRGAAPVLSVNPLPLQPVADESSAAWVETLGPVRVGAIVLVAGLVEGDDGRWQRSLNNACAFETVARREGMSSHDCMLAFMAGALCGVDGVPARDLGSRLLPWGLPDAVVDAVRRGAGPPGLGDAA